MLQPGRPVESDVDDISVGNLEVLVVYRRRLRLTLTGRTLHTHVGQDARGEPAGALHRLGVLAEPHERGLVVSRAESVAGGLGGVFIGPQSLLARVTAAHRLGNRREPLAPVLRRVDLDGPDRAHSTVEWGFADRQQEVRFARGRPCDVWPTLFTDGGKILHRCAHERGE